MVDLSLAFATGTDATAIAELRAAAAHTLTLLHGRGHWSASSTEKEVLRSIRESKVILARIGAEIVGTLTLGMKKPWAIAPEYFTPVKKVLGAFYAKHGFKEMGRVVYRGNPLVYFELLLT